MIFADVKLVCSLTAGCKRVKLNVIFSHIAGVAQK